MSTNAFDRQKVLAVVAELGIENIGAGKGVTAKLPQGAVIVGVLPLVTTAFNTGGTTPAATITVSDGTTTFVNAQSVLTAGAKTVAVSSKHYPAGGTVTVSLAESAASGLVPATAGNAVVTIQYVQLGAGGDIYG